MLIVTAGVDADAAAVSLTRRATIARSANASSANAAGTRLLTAAAMCGIRGEVAAAVDRAAVLDPYRAVCPLADSAPALDRDEVALAHLAARPAIVHIRLEIDADTAAVGQSVLTGRSVSLRGGGTSLPAAGDGHGGQESERLPARGTRGKDAGQNVELMVHGTSSAALM
ncbi:MAG TPA: hypothetical protein VFY70_06110 [Thermomicrobiales bacterium]|nr:hypothetical protein [Thermomicrobiales bacterium]